jgi:hypothetical protein
MAVVSTSGVVVALLGGLAAIATRSENFVLPCSAKPFLIIAGILFLGAIACGIGANWPRRYRESGLEDLDALLSRDQWDDDPSEGERRVAKHRSELLTVHRRVNGTKADLLKWAMVLEAVAILSAAIVVGIILLAA